MTNYEALVNKGNEALAQIAGAEYADNVFTLAAQNVGLHVDDERFHEQMYNSISGALECLDAPDAYYDAAIQ